MLGRKSRTEQLTEDPRARVTAVAAGVAVLGVAGLLIGRARKNASTPPPPLPGSVGALAESLKQVAELHTSGALSDAEFAAAKARLLRA
jgi:hypothetical protein